MQCWYLVIWIYTVISSAFFLFFLFWNPSYLTGSLKLVRPLHLLYFCRILHRIYAATLQYSWMSLVFK